MKVLLLHYHELDELGGVEVLITQLAEGFTKAGHPTGIVEMANRRKPSRLWRPDVPIWTLSALPFPSFRRPRSWAAFLRTLIQLRKVIAQFKPDIVHVHFPGSQCLPVVGLSLLPHRWRLVVTTHGSDIRTSAARNPQVRLWQGRLMNRADSITSVSRAMLEDTMRLYPQAKAKGRVIYNGIGEMWFEKEPGHSEQNPPYLLFVGRFHHAKGIDVLLEAWKQIKDCYPDHKLVLVGDGPDREMLYKTAQEYGLAESVEFHQAVKNTQLLPLYENAIAVVMPSRNEGLPIVSLESGARGKVCVGTRVGGVPEVIVNGETGFLVASESPQELANAIRRVFALKEDERGKMGEAARLRVRERFSQKSMISNYLNLYASLR